MENESNTDSGDDVGDDNALREHVTARKSPAGEPREISVPLNPVKRRRSKKKYKTLFCSSCWRDEGHIPLVKSIPVIVFLTILTLGTYLLFRTYKCRLCGNERMASGE